MIEKVKRDTIIIVIIDKMVSLVFDQTEWDFSIDVFMFSPIYQE